MFKPAKSLLTIIAVVAALFIPTYIAIGSYIGAQFAPVSEKNVTKLEITDINGNTFILDSDNEASLRDISGFVDFNNRAIEKGSLPDALKNADYFEFKYYSYDRVQVYKYYFSQNSGDAYFVNSRGKAYHINEEDAALFLSTKYARCLYSTTTFPTMTISDEVLRPTDANWVYKTYGGDYVALENIESAAPTERVYQMKGAFALSFDNEPDYLNVTIKDNDSVIFSDDYENIANASLEGRTINVVVDAKWYEEEGAERYGSARYEFNAKILLPAVFYLGETSVEPGEFIVISAKNVDDPTQIKFTSDPAIDFTPTFFKDGYYMRALVPISYEFDSDKYNSIKFTCSYGEVTQEMTLDIINKTFGHSTIDISPTLVSQSRTETTIRIFEETMTPIVKETSSEIYWDGLFLEGLPLDMLNSQRAFINTGFGRYRTITATGETYRHQGVDYYAPEGADILAVNNGKVVYAGYLDLPGHVVVVDHGLGLKSWYCHLDSIDVTVGDTVEKGAVLGKVGETGFASRPTAHIGLSVYDVPVCPYDLWEEGILMAK